jgi:hypothetical protein
MEQPAPRAVRRRTSHPRLPPAVGPRLGLGAEPGLAVLRGDDRAAVIPLTGEVVDPFAGPPGDVPLDVAAGRRFRAALGTAALDRPGRNRGRRRHGLKGPDRRLRPTGWRRG